MRIGTRSHDPERYDDSAEPSQVQNQNGTFDQRQMWRQESVESDGEHDGRNGQESSVVRMPHVALDIQRNQALNDAADHERDASKIHLPSNGCEPPYIDRK